MSSQGHCCGGRRYRHPALPAAEKIASVATVTGIAHPRGDEAHLMPATLKKIRRRRPRGEVSVEQTHDPALIAAMLDRAGAAVPIDLTDSGECFLMAYLGDDPV